MHETIPHWREIGEISEPKAAIEAGDLDAALSAFATRQLLDYRVHMRIYSDCDICGFGATLWMMGDTLGAAQVWSRVCEEAYKGKFTYSSTGTFQGGLLLWFAAVWLKDEDWHDDAANLLDKLLRKKRPSMGSTFPSLLAKLLRKEIDLEQVLAAPKDGDKVNVAHERQALFYAGVRSYEAGEIEATRRLWAQVKPPTYSQVELEYYLLAHQRKLLDNG